MVKTFFRNLAHHDHGHHGPTIPDYRIYKVEDVPELLKTQKALEARGLRDPWLRNEVWRYNPEYFDTYRGRVTTFFMRGFKLGFAAFVVTIAGTAAYDHFFPSEHDHGHGSHDSEHKH